MSPLVISQLMLSTMLSALLTAVILFSAPPWALLSAALSAMLSALLTAVILISAPPWALLSATLSAMLSALLPILARHRSCSCGSYQSVLGLKLTCHGDEICHRYMQDRCYRAAVHPSSYSNKIDMRCQETSLDGVTPANAKPCFRLPAIC
jgi:hypothetical protein